MDWRRRARRATTAGQLVDRRSVGGPAGLLDGHRAPIGRRGGDGASTIRGLERALRARVARPLGHERDVMNQLIPPFRAAALALALCAGAPLAACAQPEAPAPPMPAEP